MQYTLLTEVVSGFLTGVGIIDGFASAKSGQTVRVRPHEKIIQHWMAFHMRQQLTFVWVCPYTSDKKANECNADHKGPIPVFRTVKSFMDHLSGERTAKVRKTIAEGDDITSSTLKKFIQLEFENPADTSDQALVWTGWLHRYRQVVKHETGTYPFLSGNHCGRMFRSS